MKSYVALLLACTGLAACGGGGGGSSGLAPVASMPAPTTTTNSTLTNLTVSQSFATAGGSLNTSGNSNGSIGPTTLIGAGVNAIGVSYNAGNQSYTISSGIGSQSWLPSDRSAAQSSSLVTVYEKKNGATTDTLVLGNNSASGLTYTNLGSWVRFVDSAPSSPAYNSYFVYGVATAPSDLPRTGSASYSISSGALWLNGSTLQSLPGTGSLTANFGTGIVQTSLGLPGFGSLTGNAAISSADASFSGSVVGAGPNGNGYNGAIAGRFYGPAAAEVGASFTMANGVGGYVDGVLIGKK